MKCVTWMLDAGVERFFAVSLSSLRRAGRSFWDNNAKVIIDFGLTEPMAAFLDTLAAEGVFVHRFALPEDDAVVGGNAANGVGVMRRRVEIARLLPAITSSLGLTVDGFIVCDCDTVFLAGPDTFPIPTEPGSVSILREWDIKNGVEVPLLLSRRSCFNKDAVLKGSLDGVCSRLGLTGEDLQRVVTYNTGVIGFAPDATFHTAWEAEYESLRVILDEQGSPVFSAYAAEQNALSLCIHKRSVNVLHLPKRFNQFPPRPPATWPADTVIAHFITFRRNCGEERYALWYTLRDRARDDGFIPSALLPVE